MIIEPLTGAPAPEQLARALRHKPGFFFLDSARPEDAGGRSCSFLGFDPFLTWQCHGDNIVVETAGTREEMRGDPLGHLRTLMTRYRATGDGVIPFRGGAVGYFGYEFGARLEGVPLRVPSESSLPDARFGFYDGFIAYDQTNGTASLVANPVARRSAAEILAALRAAVTAATNVSSPSPAPVNLSAEPEPDLTRDEYLGRVERVRAYIASGDVYQVNLSQRFTTRTTDDPFVIYERLRAASPAPFGAYLDGGGFQILSSSPELFLRAGRDGQLLTRPIKGTRPRGATPAEDHRLAAELLASEKDHAELLMIVDLERNDLGRVCRFGSVRVEERHRIESHPTVHHLVATVSGRLAEGRDIYDALRALLPGGSITGAPKIRAMQIIAELEPCPREVYTGAIGWLGFDGTGDFNIAIRTLVHRQGRVSYHVGGGVVWDSVAEAEYDETLTKGRAMRAALLGSRTPRQSAPAFLPIALYRGKTVRTAELALPTLDAGFALGDGLFETIRVQDGRAQRLAAHQARLADAARRLGLPSPGVLADWQEHGQRLIAANSLQQGSLKFLFFRDRDGWSELILARSAAYTAEQYARGFQLKTIISAARTGPIPAAKSLDYRANLEARQAAQAAGFDEALFVDPQGFVLEGAVSNLFLVRQGTLITPPLSARILPGVMRAAVLALNRGPVEERPVSIPELLAADEVFVTNALLGIMPVARIDTTPYDLTHNPVTSAVQAALGGAPDA